MKGHSLIANGNPNGTAKEGTKYLSDVWNDNIGNLHEFVRKSGYNLIPDDVTQLHKAIRASWVSTYVYNTSAIETQTVDDIVLGSDNNYYRCKNDGVIGDDPVGSVTGNWEILPISEQIQLQLDSKQATLISGTNIKTVNGTSLLASGDLIVSAGSGGYAANVYFTTLDSTTNPSYKQLSYTPSPTETTISVTVNNNTVLLEDYIFDGDVKTTTIPAGEWGFTFDRFVDNTAGDTRLRFDIFARTSGGVETVLFSLFSAEINDLYYVKENILRIQPSYTVNTTDRIGVKVYGTTTRTSNTLISFKLGNGDASHFNTPLEIRHSQLRARDELDSHPISAITNLQSNLDSKQSTITGAATTIVSSNLAINRVLLSDGSGKVGVSTVTNIELAYLSGLSSNLQTQLDNKVTKNENILAGTFTKITYDAKGLVLSGSTLSAMDIPSLDASKITSGILPIIYGGTGNNGINPMIKGLINNYCTVNQLNGTDSATNALRTALSENNIVYILGGTRLYIDATGGQILIPEGKAIIGLTGTGMQPNRSGYTSGANTAEIRILNTGSAGIQLNNNIRLENISIVSYSNSTTPATPATFAGTGLITPGIVCSNVYLNRVGIYGFNKGIDIATNGSTSLTRGNWHITDCQFDNTTDISTGFVFDTIYVSRCHSYPFMGSTVTGTGVGTPRAAFIDCVNEYNDWLQVDHCFSHSNRKMIDSYFSGTCTGGGYDFEDYSVPSDYNNPLNIGIHCKVGSNNRGLATITGVRFNGGQVHVRGYFNNNDNNISQLNISGCTHERATYTLIEAIDVDSIIGGGVINIVGMITGKNTGVGAVTPQHIFYATGTSKINISGWTACPVSVSEKGGVTANIIDIGRMTL